MQAINTSKILMPCMVLAGVYTMVVCIMLVIHGTATPHWAVDALPYITSYDYKLIHEGRWINYMLFPYLKEIDPGMAWIANVANTAGGLYVIWKRITNDDIAAVLLAASCVFFPGFIYQNDWPNTLLPGSTLFLLSCLLCCYYGWRWIPICTVVLLGCIQWFAFILPLAVIPKEKIHNMKSGAKLLIPGFAWIGGILVGALVCGLPNLVAFGEFGVKIPSWRNPNPVTGLDSLVENLVRYSVEFAEKFTQYLGFEAKIAVGLYVFVALGAWVYANWRTKMEIGIKIYEKIIYMGYAVVVMISPYLSVVMIGIVIGPKTLLPTIAGFIAILIGGIQRFHTRSRMSALLVFAIMGASMGYESVERTQWGKLLAQIQVRDVLRAHPRAAETYTTIVVDARQSSAYFHNLLRYLPQRPRWGRTPKDYHLAAAFSAVYGVTRENILFCPPLSHQKSPANQRKCSRYFEIENPWCDDVDGNMCVLNTENQQLIIRLLP